MSLIEILTFKKVHKEWVIHTRLKKYVNVNYITIIICYRQQEYNRKQL